MTPAVSLPPHLNFYIMHRAAKDGRIRRAVKVVCTTRSPASAAEAKASSPRFQPHQHHRRGTATERTRAGALSPIDDRPLLRDHAPTSGFWTGQQFKKQCSQKLRNNSVRRTNLISAMVSISAPTDGSCVPLRLFQTPSGHLVIQNTVRRGESDFTR